MPLSLTPVSWRSVPSCPPSSRRTTNGHGRLLTLGVLPECDVASWFCLLFVFSSSSSRWPHCILLISISNVSPKTQFVWEFSKEWNLEILSKIYSSQAHYIFLFSSIFLCILAALNYCPPAAPLLRGGGQLLNEGGSVLKRAGNTKKNTSKICQTRQLALKTSPLV